MTALATVTPLHHHDEDPDRLCDIAILLPVGDEARDLHHADVQLAAAGCGRFCAPCLDAHHRQCKACHEEIDAHADVDPELNDDWCDAPELEVS
jgi:hypothetical protein